MSVGKADLLSVHVDSKQSMEAVDLPLTTCYPFPSLTTVALRLGEVRRPLLDLDPGSLGVFPLFLRELLMLWLPVLM